MAEGWAAARIVDQSYCGEYIVLHRSLLASENLFTWAQLGDYRALRQCSVSSGPETELNGSLYHAMFATHK